MGGFCIAQQVVKKVLLKPRKEVVELAQRKTFFKTVCKVQGKCCQMIIDSGSTDNLVSTEVVEILKLKTKKHPTPYKVSWIQKGHQLLVNEQCEVELQLDRYKDKILCTLLHRQNTRSNSATQSNNFLLEIIIYL